MILLRSALFNIYFFALTLVVTLTASMVRLAGAKYIMMFGRFWARCLLAGVRILCGIHLHVEGAEHLPKAGALIASRHESAFDTFVWFTLVPDCCYVLKRDLLRVPLFGGLVRAGGMIAIDRKAGSAALRRLMRDGADAARRQQQIVIFPEGTRAEHGQPKPLQPGIAALAASTGLPVIPVATDSGLCWGRRAFRKRPGTIRIVIGRPIAPGVDRQTLMRLVEIGIRRLDYVEPEQRSAA